MIKSIIPDREYSFDDKIATVDGARIEINLLNDNLKEIQIYYKEFYLKPTLGDCDVVCDVYESVINNIKNIFSEDLSKDHLCAITVDKFEYDDICECNLILRDSYFVFKGFKFHVSITFCYDKKC